MDNSLRNLSRWGLGDKEGVEGLLKVWLKLTSPSPFFHPLPSREEGNT